MIFEYFLNADEFLVDLAVPLRHLGGRLRRANAGHHVLTLRVDQKLAVKFVLAGRRIAGKRHPRTRVFAHVTEDHRLHVHGRAQEARDAFDLAIADGPFLHPTLKDRLDGQLQLTQRVLGKGFSVVLPVDFFVGFAQFDHAFGRHVGVELGLVLDLDLVECRFEIMMVDAHHHVAIHVDQPTIRIVSAPLVAGGVGQPDDRLLVQPQVQDGVHHARHRHGRPGADRDQQWVVDVAELLAGFFFQRFDRLANLRHQTIGQLASAFVVSVADGRGDREARRHRQSNARHFRQIRPLAAQQLLLRAAAVGLGLAEVVSHLRRSFFCHRCNILAGELGSLIADGRLVWCAT